MRDEVEYSMITENKHLQSYCSEPLSHIENYEKACSDTDNLWQLHHKMEIQSGKLVSRASLIQSGLYYNRPASELIFLRRDQHVSLHSGVMDRGYCRKPVEMTRLSDGFVKKFSSASSAALWLRENNYPLAYQRNISRVCRGVKKSAYGAKWRFV